MCTLAWRTSRVAAIPSFSGIETSISTTSGLSWSARRTPSNPSAAWPQSSQSGNDSRIVCTPRRTKAWSSTIKTRGMDLEPAVDERDLHTVIHNPTQFPLGVEPAWLPPVAKTCSFHRGKGLSLDDLILDGVSHQFADGVYLQLAHDVGAVSLCGFDADPQCRSHFFAAFPLC